jgi:hypothetical protein
MAHGFVVVDSCFDLRVNFVGDINRPYSQIVYDQRYGSSNHVIVNQVMCSADATPNEASHTKLFSPFQESRASNICPGLYSFWRPVNVDRFGGCIVTVEEMEILLYIRRLSIKRTDVWQVVVPLPRRR